MNISLDTVLQYPSRPWDYSSLLSYKKWTIHQILILKKQKKIDWKRFSSNIWLDFDILYHYLSEPWDWHLLAIHPNFPPQVIYQDNILLPRWKWNKIFFNPRISISFWESIHPHDEFLERFHEPFILQNHFRFDQKYRIWAAIRIQKLFHVFFNTKKILQKTHYLCVLHQSLPLVLIHEIFLYI
jgi:hypothetical protein